MDQKELIKRKLLELEFTEEKAEEFATKLVEDDWKLKLLNQITDEKLTKLGFKDGAIASFRVGYPAPQQQASEENINKILDVLMEINHHGTISPDDMFSDPYLAAQVEKVYQAYLLKNIQLFIAIEQFLPPEYFICSIISKSHSDVYGAYKLNERPPRRVVVKVASSNFIACRQLANEYRIMGRRMRVEGVPQVLWKEVTKERVILVEEPWGTPLDQAIERLYDSSPKAKVSFLLDYVEPAVAILRTIHTKWRVLHRDIKPSNMIIDDDNHLRFIDFGLAIYRKDQKDPLAFVGTREYASPSVLDGEKFTPQDDFYSLCCSFYSLEIGESTWYEENKDGKEHPSLSSLVPKSIVLQKLVGVWNN